MTTIAVRAPARGATTDAGVFRALALREMRRYLRHPLFLLGTAVLVATTLTGPDEQMSMLSYTILPAVATGIFGLIIMASLARNGERVRSAAGAVPVPERTRTLALAAACLVPFAVGLVWWVWASIVYLGDEIPPSGFPFGGEVSDGWALAVLFGQGPMACLGGPLLGLLVARWLSSRAAPALTAVGLIAACITLQGLIEELRRIRPLMPWTYFGGPYGIPEDPERMLLLTGSPFWWVAYLACLCGLGLIAALLHDREQPRGRLWRAAAVLGALAVVTVLLAMFTGVPETVVNPEPSGMSWGG
jgi:hypothetical protein